MKLLCPRCQTPLPADGPDAASTCPSCGNVLVASGGQAGDDGEDWLSDDWTNLQPQWATADADGSRVKDDFDPIGEGTPVATDWIDDDSSFPPLDDAGNDPTSKTPNETDAFFLGDDVPPLPPGGGGARVSDLADREDATEYRIKCHVCDSILYVTEGQVGSSIKCGDCYSSVLVTPPPAAPKKGRKAAPPRAASAEPGDGLLGPAPTRRRPSDPFQRSAQEILDKAEQADREEPKTDFSVPDLMEWLTGVFGVLSDPVAIVHALILTAAATVLCYLSFADFPLAIIVVGLGAVVLGLATLSCGLAVLESAANESDATNWPTADFDQWLGGAWYTGAAVAVAGGPAALLMGTLIGPGLLTIGLVAFSIWALLPIVLLSMLDHDSVAVPFSTEVARSFNECREAWGGLYLSSAIVLGGTYLLTIGVVTGGGGYPLLMFGVVAAVFCYFAMIGRVAHAIGQSVQMHNEGIRDAERAAREVGDDPR